MSNAVKKFLFDTVFGDDEKEVPFSEIEKAAQEARLEAEYAAQQDATAPVEEPEEEPEEPEVPTFSEEELAQARAEAFAQGKAEAAREAAQATEAAIAGALEAVSGKIDALRAEAQAARNAAGGEGVAIAAAIVRKLLPATDPAVAGAEILNVVDAAMGRIYEEPNVVIRVNDALVAGLEDRIRDIASRGGYPGALTVSPDPDVPVGDCRIEWGTGGVERDLAALWTEVEEIIQRNTGVDIADMPEAPRETPAAAPEPAAEAPAPAPRDDAPPQPADEAPPAPEETPEPETAAEPADDAMEMDDTAVDAALSELEHDIASREDPDEDEDGGEDEDENAPLSPAPEAENAERMETDENPDKPLGGDNG